MTEPRSRSNGASTATAEARTPGAAAGRASRRKKPTRKKRVLRIAALTASGLVLVTAGTGAWLYNHLSGNLTSVSLKSGGQNVGGTEKPDAFGRTPINILLIGTDARSNAEDCQLGGACNGGTVGTTGYGNADVEMVVHIAADRSNATVLSIPRDTMVNVPACSDEKTKTKTAGYFGMVNSALNYGPACQVATIHKLTGIPIDHFSMIDFSGVVKMSDAVGGVQVCVNADVYDTYSHLKLKAGQHTLKGEAALMFVRSRHGFGDGGDLSRTYAQHLYLGALMRSMKSAGTLTNPVAMYSLGDAATKALTVDDDLGSVAKLAGLATDLDKVPTSRISLMTMQTAADPSNKDRLVPAASSGQLFAALANDQSLTGGAPAPAASDAPAAPSGAAAPQPAPSAPPVRQAAPKTPVRVENDGGVTGRAGTVTQGLTAQGYTASVVSAKPPTTEHTSTLTYGPGLKAEAEQTAATLGLPASHLREGSGSRLTLVIGTDWGGETTFTGAAGGATGGGASTPTAVDTKQALADTHVETADQGNGCAQVSTYKTVELNGVSMTPSQAYEKATDVPDSAP
ncbi:transcriptional regulator [Kitasatospora sp. MMS16-BH015]|uniref:LCP family protein n=1 Tax=Kitasatospora sp. MMS16-BH015 TaxID=2018025 RepID=UPI000CA2EAE1|nr:LCP family protein [Kitasatospora sp. MMS16-BH015]AUG77636.1 transcriptional regulator [Kitasatospora sp. MMS16-BH015]